MLLAFGLAVLLVAVVTAGAYLMNPKGTGANSLAEAIDSLPHSGSVVLLEQERQNLIVMNAAAKTLSAATKPVMVNPSKVVAAQQAAQQQQQQAAQQQQQQAAQQQAPSAPAPDPGTAQSIGYNMLPSFGFSQSTQWGCLLNLWNRESGWVYDAENASGAYGIPQALPGSKMASAGADWQTNPATQLKWALQYMNQTYGSPNAAWAFWQTHSAY